MKLGISCELFFGPDWSMGVIPLLLPGLGTPFKVALDSGIRRTMLADIVGANQGADTPGDVPERSKKGGCAGCRRAQPFERLLDSSSSNLNFLSNTTMVMDDSNKSKSVQPNFKQGV